jgi:hypothetical protein
VSARPEARAHPAEAIAGFLAAIAIFGSFIGLAYRPARLIPFSILLALLATAIGGRHARLAAFAVGVGAVCFLIGMAVAVITNNPIY